MFLIQKKIHVNNVHPVKTYHLRKSAQVVECMHIFHFRNERVSGSAIVSAIATPGDALVSYWRIFALSLRGDNEGA